VSKKAGQCGRTTDSEEGLTVQCLPWAFGVVNYLQEAKKQGDAKIQ
jgi:hypothetical protein